MDFITVVKEVFVDNYGPECSNCGIPILVTSLMFQDSKSARVGALVFNSHCLTCEEIGEVKIDKELKEEPNIRGSLRLVCDITLINTDEVIAAAMDIVSGSR